MGLNPRPPRPYGVGPYGVGPYAIYDAAPVDIGGSVQLTFAASITANLLPPIIGGAVVRLQFAGRMGLTYGWVTVGPCETGTWVKAA